MNPYPRKKSHIKKVNFPILYPPKFPSWRQTHFENSNLAPVHSKQLQTLNCLSVSIPRNCLKHISTFSLQSLLFQHQQEVLIPANTTELTQEMTILQQPKALKYRSSLKQIVKFMGQTANQLGCDTISFIPSFRQLNLWQKHEICGREKGFQPPKSFLAIL